MSGRDGADPDGIWRIGPVRLLAVVALAYLGLVLTLTVSTLDVGDGPPSAVGADRAGVATDIPGSSDGFGYDSPSPPAVTPSPTSPAAAPPRTTPPAASRPAPPPARPTPVGRTKTPAAPPPAPRPAAPVVTSYEAESPGNGLTGTRTFTCSGCSGQKKVGYIGAGMGTLHFNGVTARTGGTAVVTFAYVNGEAPRVAQLSVNGGPPVTLTFQGTGGWSTVGTMAVRVGLRAGANTLTLFNRSSPAPDFDKITVSAPAR